MKNEKVRNIILDILITLVIAFSILNILKCSSAETVIKDSDYKVCIMGVTSGGDSWSLFGDIVIPKTDSAAVTACDQIHQREYRDKMVEKYCEGKFDQSCANKLEFVMEGVPKTSNWKFK